MEAQAQDRIHRLGQHKPIDVTRFVIGGTIEERILKLQARCRPSHLPTKTHQKKLPCTAVMLALLLKAPLCT